VIENVLGLLSGRAGCDVEPCPWCMGEPSKPLLRALGCVAGDLSEIGYDAIWETVPASACGAPHRRERVFIFAARSPDSLFEGLEIREIQSHG
jgi:DNA (cytosine-5)-methyltransferase 1